MVLRDKPSELLSVKEITLPTPQTNMEMAIVISETHS
jgi:hypothetical protein